MVKDIWEQEICNGDFVVSASKSLSEMVMGVMKDVEKQTRIRVNQHWKTKKWKAAASAYRMYSLSRTLKLPDEMIAQHNPELFDVMNDIRESLNLPTNRELKYSFHEKNELKRLLENAIK